jgi:hypothetical protein
MLKQQINTFLFCNAPDENDSADATRPIRLSEHVSRLEQTDAVWNREHPLYRESGGAQLSQALVGHGHKSVRTEQYFQLKQAESP